MLGNMLTPDPQLHLVSTSIRIHLLGTLQGLLYLRTMNLPWGHFNIGLSQKPPVLVLGRAAPPIEVIAELGYPAWLLGIGF